MNGYRHDRRRDRAARAAKRREMERRRAEERQRAAANVVVAMVMVMGLLLALPAVADFADTAAAASAVTSVQSDLQCEARYSWPVAEPNIEQKFEQPPEPWLPGHRGVDLAAEPGTAILAPQTGIISFVGKVAGKDVVSVRHRDGITSTFEPARTELKVGSAVKRGQHIGTVGGQSDHCEDRCLHWGLKRGTADYLDPERYTGNKKIVLKPS